MSAYHVPMEADCIYPIYSRAVGQEKLFKYEDNYRFFLIKFKFHINPIADTFAWCLLPNHFHFLIKVKSFDSIKSYYTAVKEKGNFSAEFLSDFIMERFSNWLNNYTKSFNKVYERKGGLFIDYMRRVQVQGDEQFSATIFYIHKNPVHHGLVKKLEDWKWSSYKSFFSNRETSLQKDEVIDMFHGIEAFAAFHQQTVYLKNAVVTED